MADQAEEKARAEGNKKLAVQVNKRLLGEGRKKLIGKGWMRATSRRGMGSKQRLVKPDNTKAKRAKNRRCEVQVRF